MSHQRCSIVFVVSIAVLASSGLSRPGSGPAPLHPADVAHLPPAVQESLLGVAPGALGPDHWCHVEQGPPRPLEPVPSARRRSGGGTPRFTVIDGVAVIETDDTLTWRDRPVDLVDSTVSFVPEADGYRVVRGPLSWDDGATTPVFEDETDFDSVRIDLPGFAFPFGEATYGHVYLTTNMQVAFEEPEAPGIDQPIATSQLLDRTPRVSPLQQGTASFGWNVSRGMTGGRLVVTWSSDWDWAPLDVQAVLHPSGQVDFSYREAPFGSPVIVPPSSLDDFWSRERRLATMLHPAGSVPPELPHREALDILSLGISRVDDTEVFVIEIQTAGQRPVAEDASLYYLFSLRDGETNELILFSNLHWDRDAWSVRRSLDFEDVGETIRMTFLRSFIPESVTRLRFSVTSWWHDRDEQDYTAADSLFVDVDLPVGLPELMIDLSSPPAGVVQPPIIESFTYPTLLVSDVLTAFQDEFALPIDALAVYQSFPTDINFYAGAFNRRGNIGVSGIGLGTGSASPTPSVLHMNHLQYQANAVGGALSSHLLNHELGHDWLFFARLLEAGIPRRLLNPESAHPHAAVHAPAAASYVTLTDSSCMGGAVWTDNGDGTFTSAPENGYYGYSWLDLYLMGLAAPEEVPSWFHLVDTDPSQPLSYYPAPGETVTGTRRDFVVEHVIDAEGPRDPSHLESPSDFFVPMVLVVRPGEDPTAGAAQVAGLCEDWMGDFALATVGRGTVTCDRVDAVSHPPDSIIDQPAGATEVSTGTTVSFLGRGDDADGDGLTLSWDFDGQAAPVTGPGPHDITFTESGVFTVTLRSRDATGRVDPSPARVDVVVTCADLPEVTGLRLTKEGSALRFRWNDLPGRPDQYLIHAGVSPEAALTLEHEVTDGSGETGVVTTTPATTRYFVVRARNLPDCLGP